MIIVGLDGAVHEAPQATGWTVEEGLLSIVTVGDDGAIVDEHGVFTRWDYVYDEDDIRARTHERHKGTRAHGKQ